MAKKKTAGKKVHRARARVARMPVKAKPVAFYKQPVVALSNGFGRIFKTLF